MITSHFIVMIYRKDFDFTGSQTNCNHSIKYYKLIPGDGYPTIITTYPKITHYYHNQGVYYATGTVEAGCVNPCPNIATITKSVLVTHNDLAIIKLGKMLKPITSFISGLIGFKKL